MYEVKMGQIFEVWVGMELIATSILLRREGTKLVFANLAIEDVEIDALRRVA